MINILEPWIGWFHHHWIDTKHHRVLVWSWSWQGIKRVITTARRWLEQSIPGFVGGGNNCLLFAHMDKIFKTKIKLGDTKSLEVAIKGVMEVSTKAGKKQIHGIHYSLDLKHNSLSVWELRAKNYKVVFDEIQYIVFEKNHENRVVNIVPMSRNQMFPFKYGGQGGSLSNVAIEIRVDCGIVKDLTLLTIFHYGF